MRQLIKQREIITDEWCYVAEAATAPAIILPFASWKEQREQWLGSTSRLGLRLGPTDPVESLASDLPRLSLIALEFGGIGEGRGYTQAQLLRRRYQFKGEIRAVGKIQRDQVFYMARCGFDAFEFPEGTDLNLALTAFNDFSVAYQPSADSGVHPQRRAI